MDRHRNGQLQLPEAAGDPAVDLAAAPADEAIAVDEAGEEGDPRARRLRALLHTQPVHALELNKGSRGKDKYEPYDLIVLQLEAIDYITDNMDPQRGVPDEAVRSHLGRLAAEMAPRRPRSEHREIAAVVLSALENEGQGRFLIGYSDPAHPGVRLRTDVELVRAVQGEDGGVELRATPQAINLLLDALDHDIESAEDAMAVMFRVQFERGRLSKAAAHAQTMRRLSISYREQIQDFLAAAARDISRVDWSGEGMATIDRAYAHLETRLREDDATMARVADQHDATDDPERRGRLAEILTLLQDCNHRHRELHTHLMTARHDLRAHHAQQRLAAPSGLGLVDVHAEVLQPALQLAAWQVVAVLERVAGGVVPPQVPAVVDLFGLSAYLWRPLVERKPTLAPVEEADLEDEVQPPPRFPAEAVAAARAVLAGVRGEQSLGELLASVAAGGLPRATDDLVAIGALEAFMTDGQDDAPDSRADGASWHLVPSTLRAARTGGRLAADRFFGDDLVLRQARP